MCYKGNKRELGISLSDLSRRVGGRLRGFGTRIVGTTGSDFRRATGRTTRVLGGNKPCRREAKTCAGS